MRRGAAEFGNEAHKSFHQYGRRVCRPLPRLSSLDLSSSHHHAHRPLAFFGATSLPRVTKGSPPVTGSRPGARRFHISPPLHWGRQGCCLILSLKKKFTSPAVWVGQGVRVEESVVRQSGERKKWREGHRWRQQVRHGNI